MSDYEGQGYNVESIFFEDGQPCDCSNCKWKGLSEQLTEIEECCLDPGDPSPVGRCPECDCLAYLDRPLDKQRERGPELLKALELAEGFLSTLEADPDWDIDHLITTIRFEVVAAGGTLA